MNIYVNSCFSFKDAPLGQLPYLTIDGVKLPQSISIARLVARRFNLAGADDLEQAKADAVVDTCADFQTAYYTKVFRAKEEERDAIKKAFLAEDAIDHLGKIEKLITLYGSNGFSVGNSLKWSDLLIWEITTMLHELDSTIVAKFPGIVAVRKSVEDNKNVSAYINSRPATPF